MSASLKKVKSLVLHVGPDKTGSTAIQRALWNNHQILNNYSVQYSSNLRPNDRWLTSAFCNSKKRALELFGSKGAIFFDEAERNVKRLLAKVSEVEPEILVLSHEGLVHLNSDELKKLKNFLISIADNIFIILYARSPISYALSAMSQRVKTGRRAWKPKPPYLQYELIIEKLIRVFGENQINVRIFDKKKFPQGDVVKDFFSIEPLKMIPIDTFKKNLISNPSLSSNGLLVGDKVIQLLGGSTPNTGVPFRKLFENDLHSIKGNKPSLSKYQKYIINRFTKRDKRYLKHTFGIVFFDNSLTQTTTTCRELSKREIETMALDLIKKRLPEHMITMPEILLKRLPLI